MRLATILALAAGTSCGLDVEGTAPVSSASDASSAPATDAGPDDAALDASPEAICNPTDTSMLVCLRFEGTIANEAPSGLVTTRADDTAYVAGLHGKALSMSPTTFVQFPNDAQWNTTRLTVEAWVNPRTLPTGPARAGLVDSNNRWGLFLYAGGRVGCSGGSTAATNLAPGQWTHVACTSDGTTVTIYLNGAPVPSQGAGVLGISGEPTNIGANSPIGNDRLDGLLDDVRIFKVARTAAEIAADARP